jgi:hypothetical protein
MPMSSKSKMRLALAVPDRSILKGKRDCVSLALLVDCALGLNRRRSAAAFRLKERRAQPRTSERLGGMVGLE